MALALLFKLKALKPNYLIQYKTLSKHKAIMPNHLFYYKVVSSTSLSKPKVARQDFLV